MLKLLEIANFGNITTVWSILCHIFTHMRKTVICALPIKILTPTLNSATPISISVIVGHLPFTLLSSSHPIHVLVNTH